MLGMTMGARDDGGSSGWRNVLRMRGRYSTEKLRFAAENEILKKLSCHQREQKVILGNKKLLYSLTL